MYRGSARSFLALMDAKVEDRFLFSGLMNVLDQDIMIALDDRRKPTNSRSAQYSKRYMPLVYSGFAQGC